MTLILDSAPLVALADRSDPVRETLLETLRDKPEALVLPAPVSAEVDYLLGERLGDSARRAFLSDLAARRYEVACLEGDDYPEIASLEARYANLGLGLSDCSIVVLAARLETTRLLTFDERHFRPVAPLSGGNFILLPADG